MSITDTPDRAPMLFSSFGFRRPEVREKFERVITRDGLKGRTCVVIPFAGFNVGRTFEAESDGLAGFGFDADKIISAGADGVSDPAFTPDFIYVPGGDPFKLLSESRKRGLIEAVRRWVGSGGATYIGVSAGAYIAARSIGYVKCLERGADDGNYSALGIVPGAIVCHAEHYSDEKIRECEAASGSPVTAIRDDGLALYKKGEWFLF